MTETIKGLNCKVEVALTFGSDVAPTAITKAYPPQVTKTSHGLLAGAAGYFVVSAGMVELDQQGILVNNPLTNTFELPGLDSTDYSTFTAAQLFMAATWATVAEAASYTVDGGTSAQGDDTRLTDTKTRNIALLLPSQNLSIGLKNAKISGTGMAFVERNAMRNLPVLLRISQAGTVLRVAYGVPGLPGESVQSGQLASGQFSLTVPAWAIKPNV